MQLENCRRQLEDARKDKVVAENEVMEMKRELNVSKKEKDVLRVELESNCKRFENQNIDSKSLHKKEILELTERLNIIQSLLEKETNDHALTKLALAHLRLHFAKDWIKNILTNWIFSSSLWLILIIANRENWSTEPTEFTFARKDQYINIHFLSWSHEGKFKKLTIFINGWNKSHEKLHREEISNLN